MLKLRVSIGPDRFHQVIAAVNDIGRPVEINTPLFAGRVLVYVKDFVGVTPDGSPPITDCSYFSGRSRKFAILIEGKFKYREGIEPYTGEEIHFGSDFDRFPDDFPAGAFNAGMRIAKFVDPATFFDEMPPSGRPSIMSPYAACMNTLVAYPAPSALSRAVLLRHHHPDQPHHDGEQMEGDVVPRELLLGGKRVGQYPWRFVGLKGNRAVDAFVSSHSHLLASSASPPPSPPLLLSHSSSSSSSYRGSRTPFHTRPPHPHKLSTIVIPLLSDSEDSDSISSPDANTHLWDAIAACSSPDSSPCTSGLTTPVPAPAYKGAKKASKFSLSTLRRALEREAAVIEVLGRGDLISGGELGVDKPRNREWTELEQELGLWRFDEVGADAMEDTTFVFKDPDHPKSVSQRRKHFVADGGKHRREFTYHPEIIYTTSFFTNFCDLNTFELRMGPIHHNIARYFTTQPIRYTLRSTRMAPRSDGKPGPDEEECFCTIAFELVDD